MLSLFKVAASLIGLPPYSTTRSPTRSPAFSAGPPGASPCTTAPRLLPMVESTGPLAIRTPRKPPFDRVAGGGCSDEGGPVTATGSGLGAGAVKRGDAAAGGD